MPSKEEGAAGPDGVPRPAPVLDPMIGMTLGSFRVVKVIGKGGMGTVYLGEQNEIGSKVAIKFLHAHLATNASLVARFYAEARAVNLIGHENIVNIFSMSVLPPNRYYLMMEMLEGRPLNVLAQGPVALETCIPILTQVCEALEAAHARGVVHRDLKHENIFLIKRSSNENFVKILDFGIAKLLPTDSNPEGPSQQTSAGMIVGTPEYMAPEQCNGENIDGRTDLYALGVIAYQLTTGRLPFTGGGLAGLLMAHQSKLATPPHEVNPNIPLGLSAAIMRSLAKKPEDRFQTASAFAAALELALPPVGGRSPTTPAPHSLQSLLAAEAAEGSPAPLPVGATPRPMEARHKLRLDARATTLAGESLGLLKCEDLSKGGCFVCTDDSPPALGVRLKIVFPHAALECVGEVVRHVTREQAAAWGMSPGFGVQFATLSAEQKEAVGRVLQGRPPEPAAAAAPRKLDDDPIAEQALLRCRGRNSGDPYLALGLMEDAELSEIRASGRAAIRTLEALRARPLSVGQQAQLNIQLAKIHAAIELLGTAQTRLAFDAQRGNFKGVAHCIAAGVTVTELESVRARFLKTHPEAETRAFSKFLAGNALEDEQPARALRKYEEALALDPLNLGFQKRFWALKRRYQRAMEGGPEAPRSTTAR